MNARASRGVLPRRVHGAAVALLAGLAGCAYAPTRRSIEAPARRVVHAAVIEGLAVRFGGIDTRDEAGGRFVSTAIPDPEDPRARWRAFVRVIDGGGGAAGGEGSTSFLLEVAVIREIYSGRRGHEGPGWRVAGSDAEREDLLSDWIERSARRTTEDFR